MTISKTYLLTYGGGFGDILLGYLMLEAGYLNSLKEREPDCKVKVAIMGHNIAAKSIFENNPYVDEIEYENWDHRHYEFSKRVSKDCIEFGPSIDVQHRCVLPNPFLSNSMVTGLTYKTPEFYLNDEEKRIANSILLEGDFIVLHPFAGNYQRTWQDKVDIRKIIDSLCNAGVKVILVGGSSIRVVGHAQQLIEEFNYERSNLTNLINKHSPLMQAYICSKAKKFIGAASCFSCLAVALNLPIFLITWQADESAVNLSITDSHSGVFSLFKKNNSHIYYFEKLPNNINDKILTFCKENNV